MTYTDSMAFRVALFTLPAAAVVGLVVLLNRLDASTGVAVASLGLIGVLTGAAMGYRADRLPGLRSRRHDRLVGAHHAD